MNTAREIARPADGGSGKAATAGRLLERYGTPLLIAPAVLFICLVFMVPLGRMAWLSVSDPTLSFDNYAALFSSRLYVRSLLRTFGISLVVTLTCIVLAYPLAYYAATRSNWWSRGLLVVAALSFWISFIVRTYAWLVILGNKGPVVGMLQTLGFEPAPRVLFTTTASVIGLVHILLPYMILALYSVLVKIDGNLDKAALSLGATPVRSFRHVTFPLSLPGLVNGSVLVFVICLGFYVTPTLLGSPRDLMVAGLIATEVQELMAWGLASALAMLLVATTLTLMLIYDRLVGLDRLWG